MDVSFILFHFNDSTLIHLLVFQLDRKSDKISKRCMTQAYCLIKVGKKNKVNHCAREEYNVLTYSECGERKKAPLPLPPPLTSFSPGTSTNTN